MIAYRRTDRDVIISTKPCILHAINLYYTGSATATLRIYDGIDANSGSLIATLVCTTHTSKMIDMHGVKCERGIYVDIIERVEEVTVFYEVIEDTKVANAT